MKPGITLSTRHQVVSQCPEGSGCTFWQFAAKKCILTLLLLCWSNLGQAKDLLKEATQSPNEIADELPKEATVKAEIQRRRNRFRLFSIGERKQLASERSAKATQLTEDLYRQTTDPKVKYKLSLKLAKLYFDQAQIQIVLAEEAYEKKLQAYLASSPPKGSKPPAPPGHEKSKEFEDKAIGILKEFVQVPGRVETDEALYFLGLIYANRGEFALARPYYQRILTEFPKSEFRWEAKLMVAEGYFEDGQFQSALKLYEEVVGERPQEPYPLYKKAWTLFNLKQFNVCIDLFVSLFQKGRQSGATPAQKEISQQIIGDMVLIYTDALKVKEGIQFYDNLAPDPVSTTKLHKMAKALNENGFYSESRMVSKHLFDKYPTAPIIPLVIATYIDTFKEYVHDIFKYHQKITEELADKLKQFPPLQRVSENPKMLETYHELERFVVKNAKNLHADAQKYQKQVGTEKKDKRAIAEAQARFDSSLKYYDLYETFFTSWPPAVFALDMAFYHGELQFERKNYERAANAYVMTLKLRSKAKSEQEKKFISEAMYGAVVSYDKLLDTQESKLPRKAEEDLSQPKPLSSNASKFLQVASLYLQEMKSHSAYQQISYRTAKVYYDHNMFRKAIPLFWNTIQLNPKDHQAALSADLILDSYNALKDYAGLVQAGDQLLAIPSLGTPESKAEIKKVMNGARFKSVETLEAQQNFSTAADAYLKLAEDSKAEDQLDEMALNNAAVNYIKANQWPKAMGAYTQLISAFPKSKFRKNAILASAEYHQLMGNFKDSQKLYKQYLQDYADKSKEYGDITYQVAFVADTLGQNSDALAHYKKYLSLTPSASDRQEVVTRLCSVSAAVDRKSFEQVRASYLGTASSATQVRCAYEDVKWNLVHGQLTDASLKGIKPNLKKYISVHEREKLAPFLNKKIEKLKHAYQDKHLSDVPPEKSAPLLQKKLGILKQMDGLAAEMVAVGVLSSLFEVLKTLALTYVDLSEDIMSAPIPSGLSEQDGATYRNQIAQIAGPLRQKGLEGMKKLIEQAGELKAANPALASVWRQYDASLGQHSLMPDWFGEMELMSFYLPTSKGRVRLKSYFDPVSIERVSTAHGGATLPDMSATDEKTKSYYDILMLCGREDFSAAWAKLVPTLAQEPKNPYLLNTLAFLKIKSSSPKEGLLVLQLAQKEALTHATTAGKDSSVSDVLDVLKINEALLYLHTGEQDRGIALLESLQEKNALAALLIGYFAIKYYNFYWARSALYSMKFTQDEDLIWQGLGEGIAKWGTFDPSGALSSLSKVSGSQQRAIRIAALPLQAAILLTDKSHRNEKQAAEHLSDYQRLQDTNRSRRQWADQLMRQ